MSSNDSIRAKARTTLQHRIFGPVWFSFALIVFLYEIIISLPTSIGDIISGKQAVLIASVGALFFFLTVLVEGPMTYGIRRVFLNVIRGAKKNPDVGDLFVGFREAISECFLLGLIRSVLVALWSLLLLVPGIIKAYSYAMAFYIQQDSPDKEWRSCLERSKQMMDGYKWKLFCLDVSFIGWYIVGALCIGFGLLWTFSYHSVARAHFYEELKTIRGIGDESDPIF